MGFNNSGPHAATWEPVGGLGSSGGEGLVTLPGLSIDNKEDTGRQKEEGKPQGGKQQKRDPRDQTGHERFKGKREFGI